MERQIKRLVTTNKKISGYETTGPLLKALYEEMQTLSKKNPEKTINASKVKLVNRLLSDIKEILYEEPDDKYLDLLDDENLPQYSDVVLMLSQFSTAMREFRKRYRTIERDFDQNEWSIKKN